MKTQDERSDPVPPLPTPAQPCPHPVHLIAGRVKVMVFNDQ